MERVAERSSLRRNPAIYRSLSGDWRTPRLLFQALDAEFHFTLDVCATKASARCYRYFSQAQNGLLQSWAREICWMNPPYGRDLGSWVAKAYEESRGPCIVAALVPARTDTRWWHDYALRAHEIRFVKGRIRFEGGSGGRATFPSVILIFRSRDAMGNLL